MRKNIFIFILILSSSLLMGKTLVTVNGHNIDDSIIPKGYEKLDDERKANLMEHLIKEELIHAELLKSPLVRDAKFQEAFNKQRILAEKEYKRVSGKNLTKAQIRNIKGSIALMLYQQKEFQKTRVSDIEVKDFFDNNRDKFQYPNSIEIANIIVKTQQEAKNIIRKLKQVSDLDKEFVKIAREHKQNGYMGWFGEGMTPDNLFKAGYRAKPKTLIDTPIKTKYGYHVLYLLNKKSAGKISYNKAKENIRNMLKKRRVIEKLQDKINNLYATSEIIY
jgi:parvulin-like peptidyl-prolyl isomerase